MQNTETLALESISVLMRRNTTIKIGDKVRFPYSVEVAAGEPSSYKSFHAKYHDQDGMIIEIQQCPGNLFTSHKGSIFLKVRFADGYEQGYLHPDSLVYIGPPAKKKKLAKKVIKKKSKKK